MHKCTYFRDSLFAAMEEKRLRMGISRSQFIQTAVEQYLAKEDSVKQAQGRGPDSNQTPTSETHHQERTPNG